MKKIKINKILFNTLNFIFILFIIGSILTFIPAIIFGKVPTKISGIVEYNLIESFNILVGVVICIISLLLFNKFFDEHEDKFTPTKFSICPTCDETYNYKDLEDGLCPKCNIKTKDLDGYYDDKKDYKSNKNKQ